MSGLKAVLTGEKPVAYYPAIARAVGGIAPALFLQQIAHWTGRSNDGWAFRTQEELEEELAMSVKVQAKARAVLVGFGVLEEARRGQPGRLHYRVNWEVLEALLDGPEDGGNRQGEPEVQSSPSGKSKPARKATVNQPKGQVSIQESKHESNSRRDADASPAQTNWFDFYCELANMMEVEILADDRRETSKQLKDLVRIEKPSDQEIKRVISKMLEGRSKGRFWSPQKVLKMIRGDNVHYLPQQQEPKRRQKKVL